MSNIDKILEAGYKVEARWFPPMMISMGQHVAERSAEISITVSNASGDRYVANGTTFDIAAEKLERKIFGVTA